jgi:hypothetical protein
VWDQQPGEPTNWFTRFVLFRDLGGGRTVYKAWSQTQPNVVKSILKAPGSWAEACAKYEWVYRAQAWDKHQQEIAAAAQAKAHLAVLEKETQVRLEMVERHAQASRIVIQSALRAFIDPKTQEIIPTTDQKVALQALQIASELERKSRDLPSYSVKLNVMSDNELLAHYEQLMGDIAATVAGLGAATGSAEQAEDQA